MLKLILKKHHKNEVSFVTKLNFPVNNDAKILVKLMMLAFPVKPFSIMCSNFNLAGSKIDT